MSSTDPKKSSTRSTLLTLAEAKKELDFAAAFCVNDITYPERICIPEPGTQDLTLSQQEAMIDGWNYSHGICSILSGIARLKDKNNYRKKSNIFQGMLSILGGVQLLALSDNYGLFGVGSLAGATPLAAPAMAFSLLCDTLNAAIDYYHAYKESTFEGWLDERMCELKFVENEIHLEQSIHGVENTDNGRYGRLMERKKKLLQDLGARCRANSNSQPNLKKILEEKLPDIDFMMPPEEEFHYADTPASKQAFGIHHKSFGSNKETEKNNFIHSILSGNKVFDKDINDEIQAQADQAKKAALTKLFVKSLSFIAMTCTAIASFGVCPPLLIAAGIIGTTISAYYLYHNSQKLISFFGNKKRVSPASHPEDHHRRQENIHPRLLPT